MAPVATTDSAPSTTAASNGIAQRKAEAQALINPFYTPTLESDDKDDDYPYAEFKVHLLIVFTYDGDADWL